MNIFYPIGKFLQICMLPNHFILHGPQWLNSNIMTEYVCELLIERLIFIFIKIKATERKKWKPRRRWRKRSDGKK